MSALPDPQAELERALLLHRQGNAAAAEEIYDALLSRAPAPSEALLLHYNRGVVLYELARFADALADFDAAIALRADHAQALNNRGLSLNALKRHDEAVASYDKALALRPTHAETHYNRALALAKARRFDEAIAGFDKAISFKPDFVEAHFNKGLALLSLGRFEDGWRLYEWRRKRQGSRADRDYQQPQWSGREDLAGKTLFVYWEQGYGDTIQSIRYARRAAEQGARVIACVQAPLVRLLQQMAPQVEVLGDEQAPRTFDFHCPLMSLPLAFAANLETISAEPYLCANTPLSAELQTCFGATAKPRIGLVWAGSATHKNDRERSAPLSALAPLLSFDAGWFSLQKDIPEADARTLRECAALVPLGAHLSDFADTAAVIAALDLVITVDTAVAHLAGAMDKPVWILLPHAADWRWLTARDDSPWYARARLFRQGRDAAWAPVVERVRRALRPLL